MLWEPYESISVEKEFVLSTESDAPRLYFVEMVTTSEETFSSATVFRF